MGANLCGQRQPSKERSATTNWSGGPQLDPEKTFIDRIKPDCLKAAKTKQMQMEEIKVAKAAKVERVKSVTLEEWLIASPAVRRDVAGINASEIQVPRQYSNNRVCPWTSCPSPSVEIPSNFCLARDSFTLERPMKIEETTHEGRIVPCLRKSNNGKVKKRVSFRLPEETDIFIFYSPEEVVGY